MLVTMRHLSIRAGLRESRKEFTTKAQRHKEGAATNGSGLLGALGVLVVVFRFPGDAAVLDSQRVSGMIGSWETEDFRGGSGVNRS